MPIGTTELRAGISQKLKLRTTCFKHSDIFRTFHLSDHCLFLLVPVIHCLRCYIAVILITHLFVSLLGHEFSHFIGMYNCPRSTVFKLIRYAFSYGFFSREALSNWFILNKDSLYRCLNIGLMFWGYYSVSCMQLSSVSFCLICE